MTKIQAMARIWLARHWVKGGHAMCCGLVGGQGKHKAVVDRMRCMVHFSGWLERFFSISLSIVKLGHGRVEIQGC